jgi:hypothetical protein
MRAYNYLIVFACTDKGGVFNVGNVCFTQSTPIDSLDKIRAIEEMVQKQDKLLVGTKNLVIVNYILMSCSENPDLCGDDAGAERDAKHET